MGRGSRFGSVAEFPQGFEGFGCLFLVQLGEGKAGMNKNVIAGAGLRDVVAEKVIRAPLHHQSFFVVVGR